MKLVLGVACLVLGTASAIHCCRYIVNIFFIIGTSAKVQFGPIADANHHNSQEGECDPDLGWLAGADGSNKCYMLVKGFDYRYLVMVGWLVNGVVHCSLFTAHTLISQHLLLQ